MANKTEIIAKPASLRDKNSTINKRFYYTTHAYRARLNKSNNKNNIEIYIL